MTRPCWCRRYWLAALLLVSPLAIGAGAEPVGSLVERLPITGPVVPAVADVPLTAATPQHAGVYPAGSIAAAVGDAPPAVAVPLSTAHQPPAMVPATVPAYQPAAVATYQPAADEAWHWQVLPDGLIYRSYLAGVKESRFAFVCNHDADLGWIWDISLGGRVGLLRYGTSDPMWPEGWQLDIEGAALLRLDPEEDRDLVGTDYRFGVPLTYSRGPFKTKFGYYHLSSHLGDELMIRYPGTFRDNYVHDSLVLGESFYLTDALRFYGEAAWAFYRSGRAKRWEFQFGMDYSPAVVNGIRGAPFFAVNAHLREEYDYDGNLVVQTGWQWRGRSGHLMRIGMQYFSGKSDQWEFGPQHEDKFGFGLWYDY